MGEGVLMQKNIFDTGLVAGSYVVVYLGSLVPTVLSLLTFAVLVMRLVLMLQDYKINKKKLDE